jgi:hypothetical protein
MCYLSRPPLHLAAIWFLLNLVESVANFYGGLSSAYLYGVYTMMALEFVSAEISVVLALYFDRWWPTALFLTTNAPILLGLTAGLAVAAHTTRQAVRDSMAEHGILREDEEDRSSTSHRSQSVADGEAGDRRESAPQARSSSSRGSAAQRFNQALSKACRFVFVCVCCAASVLSALASISVSMSSTHLSPSAFLPFIAAQCRERIAN